MQGNASDECAVYSLGVLAGFGYKGIHRGGSTCYTADTVNISGVQILGAVLPEAFIVLISPHSSRNVSACVLVPE